MPIVNIALKWIFSLILFSTELILAKLLIRRVKFAVSEFSQRNRISGSYILNIILHDVWARKRSLKSVGWAIGKDRPGTPEHRVRLLSIGRILFSEKPLLSSLRSCGAHSQKFVPGQWDSGMQDRMWTTVTSPLAWFLLFSQTPFIKPQFKDETFKNFKTMAKEH